MKKAAFLKNGILYYVEHNKLPNVGTVEVRNEDYLLISTEQRVYTVDDTYQMTQAADDSVTYSRPEWNSSFTIRSLELADAAKIFPKTIKIFNDLESLEIAAWETIMASGIQAETETDTYSFTVSTEGVVLELIQTTVAGDILFRSKGDWVQLGPDDDVPTIFGPKLIDIDPNDLQNAIATWDLSESSGQDLTFDKIRPFASVIQ